MVAGLAPSSNCHLPCQKPWGVDPLIFQASLDFTYTRSAGGVNLLPNRAPSPRTNSSTWTIAIPILSPRALGVSASMVGAFRVRKESNSTVCEHRASTSLLTSHRLLDPSYIGYRNRCVIVA